MVVIYVAGPFRAAHQWGIVENVRAAERIGLMIANAGAMPLIPHANTAHFHGLQTAQFWLDGTMELLRRCDAAIFLPRWRHSAGSVGEFREAGLRGLPRLTLDTYPEPSFAVEISGFVHWLEHRHGKEDNAKEQRTADRSAED